MAHYAKVTPQKIGTFFAELRQHGNATLAARATGIARITWYKKRLADPGFADAWDDARATYAEMVLEVEADRRAVAGVHHRTYFDSEGNPVGEERRYSDTLLIFRLKALKPREYKERLEVGEDPENPFQHLEDLSATERALRLLALQAKLQAGANGHDAAGVATNGTQ